MRNKSKFPFKLVVVDNASTDGTREYLSKHKSVIDELILNPKNIGCVAFNDAIRRAEGHYISLQADDHILAPNWMKTMYRVILALEANFGERNVGYVSSALHYAIPKEGSERYLRSHTVPYEHWFNNPWIRIDHWKGTHERKTHYTIHHFGDITYMDAHAVGNGGTIIPRLTFKRLGLFRTYGLRGLYDGEFRSRCKIYGLRVGYTPNTAFIHVKENFLRPERVKQAYASIEPTEKQQLKLARDWKENMEYAKKGLPPPSVPKL